MNNISQIFSSELIWRCTSTFAYVILGRNWDAVFLPNTTENDHEDKIPRLKTLRPFYGYSNNFAISNIYIQENYQLHCKYYQIKIESDYTAQNAASLRIM